MICPNNKLFDLCNAEKLNQPGLQYILHFLKHSSRHQIFFFKSKDPVATYIINFLALPNHNFLGPAETLELTMCKAEVTLSLVISAQLPRKSANAVINGGDYNLNGALEVIIRTKVKVAGLSALEWCQQLMPV